MTGLFDRVQEIELGQIKRDFALQPRAKLRRDWIKEYARDMAEGAEFQPIVVFFDDETYWLADGFHRVFAAEKAGLTVIQADVRAGGRRDALLFSVGANAAHGRRRTNEDKRRAVDVLLNDPEYGVWSDSMIAAQCGVSDRFVAGRRRALSPNRSEILATRRVARGGTTYNMNTRKIGEPLGVSSREAAPIGEEAKAAIYGLAAAPDPEKVFEAWKVSSTRGSLLETVEKALQWLTELCDLCTAAEPIVGNGTYDDAFADAQISASKVAIMVSYVSKARQRDTG
jgi:hypothetical protein